MESAILDWAKSVYCREPEFFSNRFIPVGQSLDTEDATAIMFANQKIWAKFTFNGGKLNFGGCDIDLKGKRNVQRMDFKRDFLRETSIGSLLWDRHFRPSISYLVRAVSRAFVVARRLVSSR